MTFEHKLSKQLVSQAVDNQVTGTINEKAAK